MCLEENYSDSPSNEYSRHYSAESESEYLRRQNMNSKLGEEQKKGHHVRKSPDFDPNSDKKQKKSQNDNGLILGRVSINTRTRPSNALLLGRVLGLDSAHPYTSCVYCIVLLILLATQLAYKPVYLRYYNYRYRYAKFKSLML